LELTVRIEEDFLTGGGTLPTFDASIIVTSRFMASSNLKEKTRTESANVIPPYRF
jgi:hypothetical protein